MCTQSAIILRDHPGTTIVTDSVTSNGLTKFIDGLGGKHFRCGVFVFVFVFVFVAYRAYIGGTSVCVCVRAQI